MDLNFFFCRLSLLFLSNLCQTGRESKKKNRKKIKKHNGVKYDGLASGNNHNFLVTNNVSSLSFFLYFPLLRFSIILSFLWPHLDQKTETNFCIETSLATECKKGTIFISRKFFFSWLIFSRFHFEIIVTFSKLRRGVEQQQQHCIMIPQWTLELGATPNHYVQLIQK